MIDYVRLAFEGGSLLLLLYVLRLCRRSYVIIRRQESHKAR